MNTSKFYIQFFLLSTVEDLKYGMLNLKKLGRLFAAQTLSISFTVPNTLCFPNENITFEVLNAKYYLYLFYNSPSKESINFFQVKLIKTLSSVIRSRLLLNHKVNFFVKLNSKVQQQLMNKSPTILVINYFT